MVKSMTGFGQSQITRDGVTVSTDIQCLNSRFFDLAARMPRTMQKWETQIRQVAQEVLTRGKVNLIAVVSIEGETDTAIRLNRARLRQYQELFRQIQDELALPEGPSFSHYTAIDDIVEVEETNREDLLRELLMETLTMALAGVQEMRQAEGANLAADLMTRLDVVQEENDTIEQLAGEHRIGDLERYGSRIRELLDGVPVDEGRLLQEVAIMADKRDITEECTRIKSHLELFRSYIDDDDDTGKRLGFLLQEMGREVNTIGAKTDHIDISHAAVRMKNELEKIREQVQNIL
ncbi:MAG: YicC family protein [Fidelibacterota bacterium]|nr:MAG: YicC family protein [Candidatus Neomarinimicrobiota bacterium]